MNGIVAANPNGIQTTDGQSNPTMNGIVAVDPLSSSTDEMWSNTDTLSPMMVNASTIMLDDLPSTTSDPQIVQGGFSSFGVARLRVSDSPLFATIVALVLTVCVTEMVWL